MMNRSGALFSLALLSVAALSVKAGGVGRALKQANPVTGASPGTSVTVSAASPNVNAIAITPVLPYPQTDFYCNVTGDSRMPANGAVFPLTIRVPVGVAAKVIFANITGTIPGTNSGCASSVVQQPGTSNVVQPGTANSVVQPGTASVVQPGTSSSSSVVQPGTASVVQPGTSASSSVVQPGTSSSSVVQPGTSSSSVVQPGTSSSSVVQPGTSSSSVVQPGTSSSSVVQPGTTAGGGNSTTSPCSTTPTTVVQQPTSVVQQPSTVVQQPSTPGVVQTVQQLVGRRLLEDPKPAPIEYISNNGSMGQPQLTVLDTVEGVPNIIFTPTAVGQIASFTGALQEAVTTTHNGFGVPYIPYRVDTKLSPNCQVLVKFIAV